ncbi:uncharacterized protein STEHIDRAFT_163904 [Stereum hirsutum FP-91666 SS1]|uniref:Uncharacterized protein n=1 Tax=Stereum hirsutum (strain FP-91666) TaxID=721885 RepID=R7RY15_STEHR|nr:uncharacterized protein STEHIDRAFT_163904 [Stereum hirsutum FP-91666 SS1]EIM79247.1 hypothetical protein STEHIDRAFT_163904 [Stereum hirsutum FP-91666 SS1]
MTRVHIKNDTDQALHIAWTSGIPWAFQNGVQPGETFTKLDMPSWLFSIEIRAAYGEEFSGDQSAEQAKTMGMACAAGTGSMLLGAVSALGALRGAIAPAAAGLVGARGLLEMTSRGGQAFATERGGFLLRQGNVLVGFGEKHLAIRFEEGAYRIFDEGTQVYL